MSYLTKQLMALKMVAFSHRRDNWRLTREP